jgi:16S rRNA (uracil1498-N3)-methyltransferase
MVTREWGDFIYASPEAKQGDFITPSAEEGLHLFRVLRKKEGDPAWVTNGEGCVYECRATADQRLRIVREYPEFGEPPFPMTLCAAILKGDGNREIVNTAVQLGAGEIIFITAQRCEGRLHAEKLEKLTRTAQAAMKQCGRSRLTRLRLAKDLEALATMLTNDTQRFLAHPTEAATETATTNPVKPTGPAALLVGPEGGFTETEIAEAAALNFRPLHLANRRLRAETAAAAGLSWLLQWMGEMRAGTIMKKS